MLEWLPGYNMQVDMVGDMAAGLTVGVVLIAEGVAYGLLTGMEPYYGLYTGIVPALVYAFLGPPPLPTMLPPCACTNVLCAKLSA